MAERRMFAKTIIDSDSFLDMPISAQLLYFHLSMRADDDGFINKPKSIMRMIGATQGDAEMLVQKKFVIPFESGVVVIKHWKIHNYIAKDRYTETKYKEEMNTLMLDENKAYTQTLPEPYTVCIHDVYELETQDREGKDRIGQERLGKESIDYNSIKDAYNTLCPSFPSIKILSDARKKAIKNNRNWIANFDWIIKSANLAKILDGNYENRTNTNPASNRTANMLDESYEMIAEWARGE